ncbi:LptA/OstA family protein [Elusimicrobiota bacterium]
MSNHIKLYSRIAKSILLILLMFMYADLLWGSVIEDSTQTHKVDIFAQNMDFDNEKEIIQATGNVEVYYKDMQLFADEMQYIKNTKVIIARGNVKFTRKKYSLNAEEILYNLNTSSGVVYNAEIKAPPIYVYTEKVVIKGEDEFFIPKGDVSTCESYPPHYKFSGSKIRLKLNSRLSAYNMFLIIRGVPIFYYPYYTKNLGKEKLKIELDIGSNRKAGNYVKTMVSYPFTENSRTGLGLDFMAKKGVGYNLKHRYRTGSGFSEVYCYYVREKDTSLDKGKLYLKGWQEIRENISLRYRTEYTSDYSFNYDYDREEGEYRKNNLYYQLGFEYTRPTYLLSVYGDKREEWNGSEYSIRNYELPVVRFALLPVKVTRRINFSAKTEYRNIYLPVNETWYPRYIWDGKFDTTRRLNFRNYYFLSLSPGFGYDGVYYREKLNHYGNLIMGVMQGWYNRFFIDCDYRWRRELIYPYLITRNIAYLEATFRPIYSIELASISSYDFREHIEYPVGNFLNTARMNYHGYRLYIRNRYDYYNKVSKEWLFEIGIGSFSQTRFKHYYLYPDRLEVGQRFNMRLGHFLISPGVRFYLNKEDKYYKFDRFLEQSLNLQWNMHCWDSVCRFLKRGEETEVWFLFNISAFPDSKVGMYSNVLERDFRLHRE